MDRRIVAAPLLACALLAGLLSGLTTTVAPEARAAVRDPLFSSPVYLPLRSMNEISCVRHNCIQSDGDFYHGDWSVDFLGDYGDPIYAAGYGVAYVGAQESGCRESKEERRGTWVWIDHGGGEITRYYHLGSVAVSDGQRVTPDTKLGTMGSTGARPPCKVPYLHFERRITNLESQRYEPPTMWACRKGIPVGYPEAWGYNTWDVPIFDTNKLRLGSDGTDCLKRPDRTGAPGLGTTTPTNATNGIAVTWIPPVTNPDLVRSYRVSVSLWHPRTRDWSDAWYYTVAGGEQAFTIPKLSYRRTYRVKVAAKDSAGYSPWSDNRDVVVADPPESPPFVKVESTRRTVRAVWRFPGNGGNRITGYEAVISRKNRPVFETRISPKNREVTWTGLRPHTRYRVSVVAKNLVGSSEPSVRKVTTR
ncbi:MAG: peptidoglycan DD-metalloendopeptidase family protein [Candidatus Nanopelagicales bacterium]